jgi:hypothetical protein
MCPGTKQDRKFHVGQLKVERTSRLRSNRDLVTGALQHLGQRFSLRTIASNHENDSFCKL